MSDHVVLCNFGGPESRDEVEPFLRKLFEDPFIIRAPLGTTFRTLLARRIAKKRAPSSAHEYEKIGYSPINRLTRIQAQQLAELLSQRRPNTKVHVVNRYTPPFAEEVIPQLELGDGRLFVLTLYPHFCHSTVATSVREVDRALRARFGDEERPTTRIYSWWHNATFLDYCEARLRSHLETLASQELAKNLTIMFSAHGIPKRYRDRGDPYVTETTAHFNELRRRIEPLLASRNIACDWQLCYQSRVGPVEWTKPYTDESISRLGPSRGGHLMLYPVSFTSDHIETLFEMDVTYKDLALQSGFDSYSRVLAPNEDLSFTKALVAVLEQHGF